MDPRLDFAGPVELRRSYIVASSYRCGSTFFCAELWRTGVLGAPAEYLNIGEGRMLRDVMMRRLGAGSPEDYLTRLLACRTSRNGVFGLKAHFNHFEPALAWCPSLLGQLAPITFIYLNRRDKMAQAVSMAKSMQTNVWTSMDDASHAPPTYSRRIIERCLADLRQQRLGWLRWFELSNITPLFVNYEDLIADAANVIRGVVHMLGVEDDAAETVHPPAVQRQADQANLDWIARFRRDDSLGPAEDCG